MEKHLQIVPRKYAKTLGMKRYFTGKPCPNQHISERSTRDCRCLSCEREKWRTRTDNDPSIKERANESRKNRDKKKYQDPEQRESVLKYQRKHYASRKELRERLLLRLREKYQKDKEFRERKLSRQREYQRTREALEKQKARASTPDGKAIRFMRSCLKRIMDNKNKDERTEKMLGYSREELVTHIERQFTKGMRWDNYGEWHIDHIIPVSHYVKIGINDPSVVNCLTNLRPMWASENISKSNTIKNLL